MRSVVVTGASTGIGWGTTEVLAGHGFHVYGSVRKQSDADRLIDKFGDRVTPLLFDITDQAAVGEAAARVSSELEGSNLAGLVNNAGIATGGPLQYVPIDEFRHQLEVNLVGVLIVTQAFLKLLGADRERAGRPGRIVNISSVGGKIGPPFLGGYSTSKHGLEGFSESLRRELMLYGIDVIIVAPGAIVTPIWDKAEQIDATAFVGTEYEQAARGFQTQMVADGKLGLPPEAVGKVVLTALTTGKPKTRYAVVKNPLVNWTIPRLMPARIVDQIVASGLGWKVPNQNPVISLLASKLGARGTSPSG